MAEEDDQEALLEVPKVADRLKVQLDYGLASRVSLPKNVPEVEFEFEP